MNTMLQPPTLDEHSISPEELSMSALVQELDLARRPFSVLVKLMSAYEERRQLKGVGWSRPWNKRGLNIFRTHLHDGTEDHDYLEPVYCLMRELVGTAPLDYQAFTADLLSDSAILGFTFYHNRQAEDGSQFEGLTISLGRREFSDATKRDRIDLILEDLRAGGRVDGRVDQLRLYVCPWSKYQHDRQHYLHAVSDLTGNRLEAAQNVYAECVRKYNIWKADPDRQWSHWSQRYIDYFGPRSFIPVGSSFR